MLLLVLSVLGQMLVGILICEILVSFSNCKKYFTTLVAELCTLITICIPIMHFLFGALSFLRCSVVDEKMRSILSVCLSLFHPYCPYFAILAKDLLDHILIGQGRTDGKCDKKSTAIVFGQIVFWNISHDVCRPLVIVRKLYFKLQTINLNLLSLVESAFRTVGQFKADERMWVIFVLPHKLNVFYFTVNKEVGVQSFLVY